ncbi:MAG: site-specific integrase [Phycisphaerae bacterium]
MEARKVTEQEFWRYRQWAVKQELSTKTVYIHLVIIKQAFKWAARLKRIPSNPFDHISLPEPAPTPQFCPNAEQMAALLAAADDEDRPLFTFLAYTGCRIGEAAELRWEDVVFGEDGGHLLIRRGGSQGTTKTGGIRRIPIHPELLPVLKGLPRKTDRVFTRSPSQFDPEGIEPLNVSKCLNRLRVAAKTLKLAENQRFKLHSFRHFFCSQLAKGGAPERYVRGLLGHRDSTVTDLYFSLYDDAALDAVKRIQIPPHKKS